MNEQKVMRCPFRKGENGDFMPCYGAGCMAYYEYDAPLVAYTASPVTAAPTKHIVGCRMAAPVVPPVSCGI